MRSPVLPPLHGTFLALDLFLTAQPRLLVGFFFSRLDAWDWQALSALVPASLGPPGCPAPISGRAVGPVATMFAHGPHTGKAGCVTVEAIPLSMF